MKRLFFFIIFAALFTNCDKDSPSDPNSVVPDPSGTIPLSMRNINNGSTRLGNICIDGDNFSGAYFASLGSMQGLGNIVSIPTTGWTNTVSVIPGNGYVAFDMYDGAFCRIYVDDYMVNTSNGVIGAEIKYQKPFAVSGEMELSSNEVTFNQAGGQVSLPFTVSKLGGAFEVTSDVPWCSGWVYGYDINGTFALCMEIKTEWNYYGVGKRGGTLTLRNSAGKVKEVQVIQTGAERYLTISGNTDIELQNQDGAFSTFSIQSNAAWTISGIPSWLHVTPQTGQSNATITVTANDINKTGITRRATLLITNGDQEHTVKYSQATTFAEGKGTLNDPYIISTPDLLDQMRKHSNTYFRLSNDIDLTTYLSGTEKGWEPVANAQSLSLDGNGYKIKGLWINRPTEHYVGLFGSGRSVEILNLDLVIGEKGIIGDLYTGALIGCVTNSTIDIWSGSARSVNNISNVFVEGNIKGGECTGGLIGFNYFIGSGYECITTIAKTFVKGKVEGTRQVGGLIGYTNLQLNTTPVIIENCFSSATLSLRGGAYTCYLGGICGYNHYYKSSITNCYVAGKIEVDYFNGGSALVGGLLGGYASNYNTPTVQSSYFDSTALGVLTWSGNISDSTWARTTAEMKQQSTYVGWDFSTIWQINNSYPALR